MSLSSMPCSRSFSDVDVLEALGWDVRPASSPSMFAAMKYRCGLSYYGWMF